MLQTDSLFSISAAEDELDERSIQDVFLIVSDNPASSE
jgi:hypothetical protein